MDHTGMCHGPFGKALYFSNCFLFSSLFTHKALCTKESMTVKFHASLLQIIPMSLGKENS